MDRQLTRRQALGAAGAAGAFIASGGGLTELLGRLGAAAPAAAATAASCTTLTPSMTEGPYWIDEMLHRSNVVANSASAASKADAVQAGVPLALTIVVLDSGCAAVNGAHVDIWHANAYGQYSGEGGQQPGGGGAGADTSGQNFLRGYQVTGVDAGVDAAPKAGQVSFRTIWPGWYQGRAIHIHVRIRTYDTTGAVATNYTTQIFFSDDANDTVLSGGAPYKTRSPANNPTTDETDNVLTAAADATNIVPVTGSIANGYAATFTVMLSGSNLGTTVAAGTDKTVSASLLSAKSVRAANGSRSVVLSVRAGETLTARARILRGSHVLGQATGHLTAGTHTLRTALAGGTAAGAATVELTLTDAHGNTRTIRRTVSVR
jgi:protocatechuate 3,4-dioxygenase beta subunit